MLLINFLFFVLVLSFVKSVPIDENKNSNLNRPSTRRATVETYRYNHPPSISIPVSVVFEENKPGIDKPGKSLKLNTEIPKKPLPSQASSSSAIPVSLVFEEETSESNKSKKLNPKISDENKTPSQKTSSETIPVSVVFEEKESESGKILEKKNPDINIIKPITLNHQSDIVAPDVVAFKEEKVSKINALKSEKPIHDRSQNNQVDTKETKNGEQITEPKIFTSTESVVTDSNTGAPTTKDLSAEPKLNEGKSKVITKPQPKQYYQLEYQIPVAVVYDEPINVGQTNRRLNNSKEQVRERNLRRRLPNSTSTTDLTENIEVTTANASTQKEPLKSEVKPNTRRRQRVKQTREKSSFEQDIPVVIQFTENENQSTLPKRKQEKSSTTVTPVPTTQASFAKLTTKLRTQSNIPLRAQNRNTSFKSQQMEERRQDNESATKRKRDPVIPIVKSDIHAYGNSGSFSYSYEGGDGTKAFEKGELKTYENDKTGESVVGGFTYKDKDGNDISLSYTADENGYRPVGAHLPTPPPIPAAIQRALAHLATKTTPAPVTEAIV